MPLSISRFLAAATFALTSFAMASNCPSQTSKLKLQSANGLWSDSEYILSQDQEWGIIYLDDEISFPIALGKIQDTVIQSSSTAVSSAPNPLPAGTQIPALFYKFQKSESACPLLLMLSSDGKHVTFIQFNAPDGVALSASSISALGIPAAVTLGVTNISGYDQLTARASDDTIAGVFSVETDGQITLDPLLTLESIWADFIAKAARGEKDALKYMTPELEESYSSQSAFSMLSKIESLQKDVGITEISTKSARLAVVLAKDNKDFIYFVKFEKQADIWRILAL